MKKVLVILLTLIIGSVSVSSKEYYKDTCKAIESGNLKKAETLLKKWDRETEKDAHYYICWFNYYYFTAQTKPVEDKSEAIENKRKTKNIRAGKIPDPEIMKKGITYLNQGIEKYPDRLDLYTTKHGALFEVRLLNELVDSASDMLKTSKEIDNKWNWEEGPYEDGKIGLMVELDKVFTSLGQFLETTQDKYKALIEEEYSLYPEESVLAGHKGYYLIYVNQYKDAVVWLEKSYNAGNHDDRLVALLAIINEQELKDIKSAIKWYDILKDTKNERLHFTALQALYRLKAL